MEFTAIKLPISGETVLIKPVSPFLLQKARKSVKRPLPPVQRANLGTADNPVWEDTPNEAHPDYEQKLKAWTQEVEEKSRAITIELGTQIEWTDEKRKAVAEIKAAGHNNGIDFDGESDLFIYVSYVAIKAAEDYNTLLKAILGESRPTEEAIQEGIATFRPDSNGHSPDVSREEHIRDSRT